MKRYCKNIDIEQRSFIAAAAYECLRKRYNRRDTFRLLAEVSGHTKAEILAQYRSCGHEAMTPYIEMVIDLLHKELLTRQASWAPIVYSEQLDPSSGKVRKIGTQSVKQQIYDYVAVNGLKEIMRRIGEYQCARPGKGPEYGVQAIRRWLRDPAVRYAAQMDIRKCYENISHDNIMGFLCRYVKNPPLLWLTDKLVRSGEQGLSIGSYLSQYLCDLYLSQLYHSISEEACKIRRKRNGTEKRVRLIKHVLFYRDDILLLGTAAKDVLRAVQFTIKACRQLGLEIKPGWKFVDLKDQGPERDTAFLDIMGYRVYRYHTTIRRRIFRRLRRAFIRTANARKINLLNARRCLAYYGRIKHTDSHKLQLKYQVNTIVQRCKRRVSAHDKSKLHGGTTACKNH